MDANSSMRARGKYAAFKIRSVSETDSKG